MKELRAALSLYCDGTDGGTFEVGCGTEDDFGGKETADKAVMRVVYDADEEYFRSFIAVLEKEYGCTPGIKENESGIYAEFSVSDSGYIYTYYIRHSREARIIADSTCPGTAAFEKDGYTGVKMEPILIQYGLYYGKMIRTVTCDCGMCYFVRLGDNRIVMLDGGEIEQCTAPAVADVMKRLHEITGTEKGGKIVIAAWLCTHAHNDHMDLFSKIIKEYADEIEVQRVVYNFPAWSVLDHAECVPLMKKRVSEYAPDAKFLKIHTGQSFTLGGVTIEALLTHEDIIQKKLRRIYDGMNGTTTVFRISTEYGSFIALGDLQDDGADELAARYNDDTLSCTYVQAAHHCINSVESAYTAINAEKVLIPQAEWDCLGRNSYNLASILRHNSFRNCIFAGNGTDVFAFGGNGDPTEHYPTVGCPYDGSPL